MSWSKKDEWETKKGTTASAYHFDDHEENISYISYHQNEDTGNPTVHVHYNDGTDDEPNTFTDEYFKARYGEE